MMNLQYQRLDTQSEDVPPFALVQSKIASAEWPYSPVTTSVFQPVSRPIPPYLTPEMMPRPQPDPTQLWIRRKLRSPYAKIYFYN